MAIHKDDVRSPLAALVLNLKADPKPPLAVKLLNAWPYLRRIPARLVGIGFRPEHVEIAEA